MSLTVLSRPVPLTRSLPQRLWFAAFDALRETTRRIADWRRLRAERAACERTFEAVGSLSDSVLDDIGAPYWLRAQAERHRDARRRELEHLRELAGLRSIDSIRA